MNGAKLHEVLEAAAHGEASGLGGRKPPDAWLQKQEHA